MNRKDVVMNSSRHLPEYEALYTLRDFWEDIRSGKHDDHLDGALEGCMREIDDRKNQLQNEVALGLS